MQALQVIFLAFASNYYFFSVSRAKEMTTKPGTISISKAAVVKIDQKSVCIKSPCIKYLVLR
jgi:hypothetical protein